MKIACLNNISNVGLNLLTKKYQLVDDPKQSNLILVRSHDMHDFPISDDLLAIARAGAGVNNIPLEKMADAGVVVFNTPGANSNAVKELVIAGMLLASRNIIGGVNWVKNNSSNKNILKNIEKAKKLFAGTEILGKTISLIGLGAVGGRVANACVDLGLKVYGYDPYISEKAKKSLKSGIELTEDLDLIYKNSNFISLHLPLLDSTKGFFNKEVFSKVKPGVVLLNFSRDLLVNNLALEEALSNGIVSKYVTDFPNHYVANLDNVIPIPHLGASTKESEDNCAIMATRELMNYVEHGDIENSVNYPNITLGDKGDKFRLIILARNIEGIKESIDKALKHVKKTIDFSIIKFRDDHVVFAFDFNQDVSKKIIEDIKKITGVVKLRII